MRWSQRRRHGSALVEAALATLPLLAFLFGTFDVAFAIFIKNTLAFAVRQGVRYAITSQTMPGMGQDLSIKTTVINCTVGLLNSMSPNRNGLNQVTITYYDPVTLQPVTGVGSNIGGNIVVVSASGLSWAWMFPLWRNNAALQFSAASADIMEAPPLAAHLHVRAMTPQWVSRATRGSAMIELALILPVGLTLVLGLTGVGVRLGLTLNGTQLTRDVGHMYALGTDFSLPGAVSIAQTLSTNFSLTSTGTAVLILSQVVQVYQPDCTAASLKTCPNLNQPVFTQRIVLGNPSLRASNFGTPPTNYLDSSGNIKSTDYLAQSQLVANGFGSVMTLADGQIAYVTEGYFSMPQLDLLNPISNKKGGYYVRLVF